MPFLKVNIKHRKVERLLFLKMIFSSIFIQFVMISKADALPDIIKIGKLLKKSFKGILKANLNYFQEDYLTLPTRWRRRAARRHRRLPSGDGTLSDISHSLSLGTLSRGSTWIEVSCQGKNFVQCFAVMNFIIWKWILWMAVYSLLRDSNSK